MPRHRKCDVSLLQFTDYVRVAGPTRLSQVAGQIAQSAEPYDPRRDYYRRFLYAARLGRRVGQDREIVEQAVEDAPAHKAGHYAELAAGWLRWAPEIADTEVLPARTARWSSSDLSVRVTPHLVVRHPDGLVEAIRMHVKVEELKPETAEVMLWLLGQVGNQLHSNGVSPVVVDVRRGVAFRPHQSDRGFSAWMHAEAAAYRRIWSMVA